MSFYQFSVTQNLPTSINEIWDFISTPENLKIITPEYMGFFITNENINKIKSKHIYPGMIITYKVSPMFGIKLNWMTEITHVKEKEYFVDEQLVGPYSLWHHQHKIEAVVGGVKMTDIVTYVPPFGILGTLANKLFIKKKLKSIFDYRQIVLEKTFGKFVL